MCTYVIRNLQILLSIVKLKHTEQLEQVEANVRDRLEAKSDKKVKRLRDRLEDCMQKLADEKTLWRQKLRDANSEIDKAKDEIYVQKCQHRKFVQHHLNDVHNNEEILKNYIESLKEDNLELRKMLKAAESDGRAANWSARKARKLAHDRLLKLCQERECHQQAEDEAIELDKTTRKTF